MKLRTMTTLALAAFAIGMSGVGGASLQPYSAQANDADHWSRTGDEILDGQFLGTLNDKPLELRANSTRGLLIDPTLSTPNLIGGDSGNTVGTDVVGGVIAGGGQEGSPNSILDDYGTVSGGSGNEAGTSDEPANTYATVGGGLNNIASGAHATIGGGNENSATEELSTVGGGDLNIASGLLTTVGGGSENWALFDYATVAGGLANTAVETGGTVGGGVGNTAETSYATIAGGGPINVDDVETNALMGQRMSKLATSQRASVTARLRTTSRSASLTSRLGTTRRKDLAGPQAELFGNTVLGEYGTVGGGGTNVAGGLEDTDGNGAFATVAGGGLNFAVAPLSTISGGGFNFAAGEISTVSGGFGNAADSVAATVGGGLGNSAFGDYATVGGGGPADEEDPDSANRATDSYATVGGGGNNQAGADIDAETRAPYTTIGGGGNNSATGSAATVAGGTTNNAAGIQATIGGGVMNTASGNIGTVSGGGMNTASGERATIAGGFGNTASAPFATVGGGGTSSVVDPALANRAVDAYSTVGGGSSNLAGTTNAVVGDAGYAVVAGGAANKANNYSATVGGGMLNTASGSRSVVAGGSTNTASGHRTSVGGGFTNTASGYGATVAGGILNVASGTSATVSGGRSSTASGGYSYAAGFRAKAQHEGAYVWADVKSFPFASTAVNQWSARATGGFRFVTGIDGGGAPISGVEIAAGSGTWSSLSDRNSKANIVAVDGKAILNKLASIPIAVWNYKSQDATVKHIGPMAQDFAASFGVGEDNTRISTVDADGVALAAIQGLHQENVELKARVEALERVGVNGSQPMVAASGFGAWQLATLGMGALVVLLLGFVAGLLVRRRPVEVTPR